MTLWPSVVHSYMTILKRRLWRDFLALCPLILTRSGLIDFVGMAGTSLAAPVVRIQKQFQLNSLMLYLFSSLNYQKRKVDT